jgi:hypothetical protein
MRDDFLYVLGHQGEKVCSSQQSLLCQGGPRRLFESKSRQAGSQSVSFSHVLDDVCSSKGNERFL